MATKTNTVTCGKDVERILRRNDVEFRRCDGSHAVATLPDGSKLTYHYHGEYGRGIAVKITKLLLAAGLLAFLLMCGWSSVLVALGDIAVVYGP